MNRLATIFVAIALPLIGISIGTGTASLAGERVFELRTFTVSSGNLDALNARFRDHTVKLFEKHGMTNIGYWNLMKDKVGADSMLTYLLAHQSQASAKENFGRFASDEAWVAARKGSEERAGGPLTIKGGVKSVFMKAIDYSPIR